MENLVPLGTGNSRLMKSNIPASTTLAQLIQMLNNGTFPYDIGPLNSAGISQQGTPLNKATLFSDDTAALYPEGVNNPNDAFEKLAEAAFLEQAQTPIYQEVTVDLSSVQVGNEIDLPYNGELRPHIVVHVGNPDQSLYDASCDGVWVLQKKIYEKVKWNTSSQNVYPTSTINTTELPEILSNYGASVQSKIKTVKIPYCPGKGSTSTNSGSNGLETKLFLLSCYETGLTQAQSDVFPESGAKLDYFISGLNGGANEKRYAYTETGENEDWWSRDPVYNSSSGVLFIGAYGNGGVGAVSDNNFIRPAFILPKNDSITYYVDDDGNLHDEQEYSVSGSITDIFGNPVIDLPATQIYTGSYTGTGTGTVTLTFPVEPTLVIAGTNPTSRGNQYLLIMTSKMSGLKACTIELPNNGSNTGQQMRAFLVDVTFNGNSVTYGRSEYGASSNPGILNTSGTAYYYIAI